MTIAISPAVRSYPDDDEAIEVLPCTECLDLLEADELTDCGTHTLCDACLADSPCSACQSLRAEAADDRADDRAYAIWRDQQEDPR